MIPIIEGLAAGTAVLVAAVLVIWYLTKRYIEPWFDRALDWVLDWLPQPSPLPTTRAAWTEERFEELVEESIRAMFEVAITELRKSSPGQ